MQLVFKVDRGNRGLISSLYVFFRMTHILFTVISSPVYQQLVDGYSASKTLSDLSGLDAPTF
jgi:hypothetical protein